MSDHHCPGLRECETHPRWHVWKSSNPGEGWWVNAPGTPRLHGHTSLHPTQAEAFALAEKEATK